MTLQPTHRHRVSGARVWAYRPHSLPDYVVFHFVHPDGIEAKSYTISSRSFDAFYLAV